MEQVAQQALNLVKDIPEQNWITGDFTDEISKCCLHGHLTRLTSNNPNDYKYSNCSDDGLNESHLSKLLRKNARAFMKEESIKSSIYIATSAGVNNGNVEHYNEPTPKQRSIALLNDMIKAGY